MPYRTACADQTLFDHLLELSTAAALAAMLMSVEGRLEAEIVSRK
jgi:hypothetical protein